MGIESEMTANKGIFSPRGERESDTGHSPRRLFPPLPESSELTVECRRDAYSASAIARAVEDADAHLLNLNVTSADPGPDEVSVDLRISHRNTGSVARSLERYGFRVTGIREGYDADFEKMRRRIDELMTRIEL